MAQYSRAQLRDVLVEFYSRVDPARLDAGIDINGMIDWIVYHGSDDMDARLQAKYGTGLNFEILNQPKSATTSAMHRISMMPNTQLIEQQQKRLELRAKVEAFYKENDPDKLATVDTFVEWIEVNGERAFNDLLMKKYGKTMGIVTRPKPNPPTPPNAPGASVPNNSKAAPPTLPPRQTTAGPDPELVSKLTRFYELHEPDQPNDPIPIAEWAMSVGINVLNEKLMQLYGGSLETLEEDEAKLNEPPPPPPDRDSSSFAPPLPPPPPEDEPEDMSPTEPIPPPPPVVTMSEPPKPPAPPVIQAPVQPAAPPAVQFTQPPRKPEPPKLAPMVSKPPPKAPEPPKFVSNPTALPKIPTYSKPTAPKPMAPAMNKPSVPMNNSTIASQAVAKQSFNQTGAGQKPRKRRPSEGACDSYVLDLSGDSFGVCVCGFNRAAHTQPKLKGTDRRSVKVRTPALKQDKPCSNYRVDLAGKKFGDCVCGWGKVDHGKVDWHPPPDPLEKNIPKAPTPAASEPKPDDVVEMAFDQATATVFSMMVESYIEQHGEEPDQQAKIDWASNLAILSAGKDLGPNPTKLKVRARNVPKRKG